MIQTLREKSGFRFALMGRNQNEKSRSETRLELFFDLIMVVALWTMASQLAHYAVEGHLVPALAAFGIAIFGVVSAWSSYTWFSSAFDNDDWLHRLLSMIQMIGIVVLTLGIPPLFTSFAEGGRVDAAVMILGYAVMRVPMVVHWLRAAKGNSVHRKAALLNARMIALIQTAWMLLLVVPLPDMAFLAAIFLGIAAELLFLVLVDRKKRIPWHAEHIAERYGSLTIIALGECMFGTVASLRALIESQGWSIYAGLLGLAAVGIALGMWWLYFALPSAKLLTSQRHKGVVWGYLHMLIFAAIGATGAGLDMVAYYLDDHSVLSAAETVLAVALPVSMLGLLLFGTYRYLSAHKHSIGKGNALLFVLLPVLGLAMTYAGVPIVVCIFSMFLLVVANVAYYELRTKYRLYAANP